MAKVSIGIQGVTPYYEFDVNPSTFSWGYTLKTQHYDTYGGRVVQILSCRLSDCTVQGYLLPVTGRRVQDGSLNESELNNIYAMMEKFESDMLTLMDWQAENKMPLRFDFPLFGTDAWRGDIYITQYGPVSYSYDLGAVIYTLQMTVDDGFPGVSHDIVVDAQMSIDSIPNGVNWVRSIYNTPHSSTWTLALEVLQEIINDSGNYQSVGLQDYYEMLQEKVRAQESDENVTYVGTEDVTLSSLVEGARGLNTMGGIIGALAVYGEDYLSDFDLDEWMGRERSNQSA